MIPVEALIVFAFVSGGTIGGFIAHMYTGYKYEMLIRDEYVHAVDTRNKCFYPIEELMKK